MILLTRRYRFAASHRLHSGQLSEERNRQVYGKCNNPHGHGHDYILEVTLRGPIDPRSGRAADLPALDRLVQERVLAAFDRKNLNADPPDFSGSVPTTENLALAIRARLLDRWASAWPRLDKIAILETGRNSVSL